SAAAERAASLGAHDQAIQQLEQALAVSRDDADRVELLIRAARSADAAGRPERGIPMAREAAATARRLGDLLAAGRAESVLGVLHIDFGQLPEAVAVLEAARDTLPVEEQGEARAELLSTLSRAYMRIDRTSEAIETAEAALSISERLELDGITAEALQNKGGSLGRLGRRHESMALMQAAVDVARSGGYVLSELRATSNVASVTSMQDLPRAHAATLAALSLARRTGHRPSTSWALTLLAWQTYLEGRGWDELIAELEEDLARAIGPIEELRLLSSLLTFQLARGEDAGERQARARELAADMTDRVTASMYQWTVADDLMARRSYAAAADGYDRTARPGMMYPLGMAVRAALWIGDLPRLRTFAQRLGDDPEVLLDAKSQLIAARAGIDALEGRRAEALAGYREAMRLSAANKADFEVALLAIDAAVALGPEEPEVARAIDEARATLTRVRAQPYLARLEEVAAPNAREGRTATSPAPTPT
ncbi:MAG TPA: hypothetical protein VGJ70_10490, partial [Solirubrobacteraceae bacterium]